MKPTKELGKLKRLGEAIDVEAARDIFRTYPQQTRRAVKGVNLDIFQGVDRQQDDRSIHAYAVNIATGWLAEDLVKLLAERDGLTLSRHGVDADRLYRDGLSLNNLTDLKHDGEHGRTLIEVKAGHDNFIRNNNGIDFKFSNLTQLMDRSRLSRVVLVCLDVPHRRVFIQEIDQNTQWERLRRKEMGNKPVQFMPFTVTPVPFAELTDTLRGILETPKATDLPA